MALSWTLSDAIASLRRRLSDGPTDKFRSQVDVDPPPDGVQRVFSVPESRLVPGTLTLYLEGQIVAPNSIDETSGSFEIDQPDEGQKLMASYYFQWFTDAELEEFLGQSTQMLGFAEGVTDTAITVQLRTPTSSFACYYAYLKKAAESAVAWSSNAAGFASDTSKEHPYWMDLAKMMWEEAQRELEVATSTQGGGVKPAMRFVSFRMPRYVPRS